ARTGRPARAGARDRGRSFAEGGCGRLQRLAGDGASLVASLAGWRSSTGGVAGSLESAAPLAASACGRAAGADLRLPPQDGLGSSARGGRDRLRPLDRVEGAPAGRALAPPASGQGAGQSVRVAV